MRYSKGDRRLTDCVLEKLVGSVHMDGTDRTEAGNFLLPPIQAFLQTSVRDRCGIKYFYQSQRCFYQSRNRFLFSFQFVTTWSVPCDVITSMRLIYHSDVSYWFINVNYLPRIWRSVCMKIALWLWKRSPFLSLLINLTELLFWVTMEIHQTSIVSWWGVQLHKCKLFDTVPITAHYFKLRLGKVFNKYVMCNSFSRK